MPAPAFAWALLAHEVTCANVALHIGDIEEATEIVFAEPSSARASTAAPAHPARAQCAASSRHDGVSFHRVLANHSPNPETWSDLDQLPTVSSASNDIDHAARQRKQHARLFVGLETTFAVSAAPDQQQADRLWRSRYGRRRQRIAWLSKELHRGWRQHPAPMRVHSLSDSGTDTIPPVPDSSTAASALALLTVGSRVSQRGTSSLGSSVSVRAGTSAESKAALRDRQDLFEFSQVVSFAQNAEQIHSHQVLDLIAGTDSHKTTCGHSIAVLIYNVLVALSAAYTADPIIALLVPLAVQVCVSMCKEAALGKVFVTLMSPGMTVHLCDVLVYTSLLSAAMMDPIVNAITTPLTAPVAAALVC